ncbi:hypothetical protein CALCODRAFT_501126 [Calocera cornea HHB12733]|uniref:PH domain-containing protein n=1 Tax=Calocera cornea HHB12733 TaxID=1353952 RepID=A0A165DSF6_9BASI|nr:hypothetical protein CALCODRAFT_501126 [Calocera cornea HHB12733]
MASQGARQRTPSSATIGTVGRMDSKDATDALWNLSLLAALRNGDPSKLTAYLSDLTKLATLTRRASASHSPATAIAAGSSSGSGSRPPTASASQNGSTSSLAGRSRLSVEGEKPAVVPASAQERAAYILHTAVRVASCQTISLLLSHKQISPNAFHPAPPSVHRTTPLHLAAQLGREDVVRLLLEQPEVDDTLRDGHGRTVAEVAANPRIVKLLQESVAELNESYLSLVREYLREPANSPPPAALLELLKSPRSHQLDLTAPISGTTVLHEAARRSHLPVIELAVQRGADIFVRDARGRAVVDVVLGSGKDKEGVRAVLRQYANQDLTLVDAGGVGRPPDLKGYLSKYANVAKGYSTRYFVLQDGTLSYYRNQSDYPHSCRGAIHTSMISVKTSSSDKLRIELILHPPSTSGLPGTLKPSTAAPASVQRWFLRGEHVGEVGRWAQALIRNCEYYGGKAGPAPGEGAKAGAGKGADEAGGPFLRKGYTRSLSISGLSRRKGSESHVHSGTPSRSGSASGSTTLLPATATATAGADVRRTGSGTSISVSGVPTQLLAGSESSDAELEDDGDGEKGPPFADWEMGAEGVKAQVEAMRSAVTALALPSSGPLLESLGTLHALSAAWRAQQKARERWYESELEKERQARKLWEESLAGVVGESERMEEELKVAGRRLRSMRNLRASIVDTANTDEEPRTPAVVASPTELEHQEKELPAPPLSIDLPPAVVAAVLSGAPKTATTDEDDEDDEFFDAIDSGLLPLTLPSPLAQPAQAPSSVHHDLLDAAVYAGYAHPRTRLPIEDDQRPPVSLWAVLKNSIGKDLTKISFPVFFNEPTSMLQRMAEDMEFSECLDAAVRENDPLKRIAFVAAFAMSNYSSTIGRIAKPFNPMLSETFEYARFDKQYRYFSEQVSHHPPISACYCENPNWLYYGEVDAKNRFMGKSFEIRPTGAAFVELKLSPDMVENPALYPEETVDGEKRLVEKYTYKKVITNVSGFILGNPTIDHYGEMRVTNQSTGDTCVLNFKPRGWRGKDAYEIKGAVYDAHGQMEWEIAGRWSNQLVMRHADSNMELGPDVSVHGPTSPSSQTTPEYLLLWRNTPKPPAPFNLTPFAITLNDLPKDPNLLKKWLPITDCRLRPDQRAFEEGRYEEANGLKSAQEDYQRVIRRARERGELPPHRPRWFTAEIDEQTGDRVWRPTMRDGKVEYWVEREEAGLAGRPIADVEKIFIDV